MKPVLVILGTRPEAIKLWPVIEELKRRDVPFRVVSTEQQPDLLLPLLDELKIHVHHYAATQLPANTLTEKLSKYICSLGWMIGHDIGASLVIVQGDTTTALAGALAAFYAGVPVAHVEAGLRTYDLAAPFPEEGNRQMISRIASLHFCPTNENRHTIIDELAVSSGEDGAVYAVGNTVVDAVKRIMVEELLESGPPGRLDILVTFHRRESWAEAAQVARAIAGLSHRYDVLWVQHANKHLRGVIEEAIFVMRFEGHDTDPPPFIRFVEPMGYRAFLRALCQAELVITDSGGVVEECTTLGKPCLMLRTCTERAEALDAGHKLLGTDELDRLPALVDELYASAKVKPSDAFGDGHAAGRIVGHIQDFLALRASS